MKTWKGLFRRCSECDTVRPCSRYPDGGEICKFCLDVIADRYRLRPDYVTDAFLKNIDTPTLRILLVAYTQGRLHSEWARDMGLKTGRYVCDICGMRAWTLDESEACCKPGVEQWRRENPDWDNPAICGRMSWG